MIRMNPKTMALRGLTKPFLLTTPLLSNICAKIVDTKPSLFPGKAGWTDPFSSNIPTGCSRRFNPDPGGGAEK